MKSVICILLAAALFVPAPVMRAGEIHELIIHDATEKAQLFLTDHAYAIEERDAHKCTPLDYAAQYSRTNMVKWLLQHKADVNAPGYDAFTPLHFATNGEIARMLIKAGADRGRKDSWGRTPLQHAAQLGHTNVSNVILDSGYPLDLTSALLLGRREDAKKIIKHNPEQLKIVEPDADLWGNTTPLGIAAGNGDVEIVKLLLAAGAPVNAMTDRPGLAAMTPLCNAVWGGRLEIAELLCKAGADCNVTGGKFYPNLLDYAKGHSDPKMIQLLVKYGAKSGK